MVAGYFYYYGHYYATLCVEQLPEASRAFYQDHLARILLATKSKTARGGTIRFTTITSSTARRLRSCRSSTAASRRRSGFSLTFHVVYSLSNAPTSRTWRAINRH